MTPDEARKDCEKCAKRNWLCDYHRGYINGYDAAQRERGTIQMIALNPERTVHDRMVQGPAKPLPSTPPGMPPHFASKEPHGRPGRS